MVKRKATFDSSFWVHAVYLDLVDFLLEDYELICTPAVVEELGPANPTSLRLKRLITEGRIWRGTAGKEKVSLYGKGERAAINLALEKKLLLLIDDWKHYEAAQQAGIEATNSVVYLVSLYGRGRFSVDQVLEALAKMTRRGTIKPGWILSALKLVAEIREQSSQKGERSDEET
ncbi:MAG: hypothetical protein HYR55_20250 [Acidobacteria bacterium]|nr:hypothetical protein [Acidobacteriota bacterium]MBI3657675.1 hypothetical protein [Acidobacteriota bacterium]